MNLKEFDEFRTSDAVKFNSRLNPAIFDADDNLRLEVRVQLLEIAEDFMQHLGVSGFEVKDITISGSNAAYTYTDHSDIDLHILVDIEALRCDDVYRELFNSKKVVYNDTHDIKIRGYDVELYVQDSAQSHQSLGEYSVLHGKWIKFPSKRRANFSEFAAKEKFKKLVQVAELAMRSGDISQIDRLLETIKKYRKVGLEQYGEFGPENLAFKALRSSGIIDKLYKHRANLHSRGLSLQEELPVAEGRYDIKIDKVKNGWLHRGGWYKQGGEIQPLPMWDKFVNLGNSKPGTSKHIWRYFNYYLNDYRIGGIPLTGNEIASTIGKLYRTNPTKELNYLNAEYEVDYSSWSELLDTLKAEIQKSTADKIGSRYKKFKDIASEDYDPNGPPPGPEFKPTMPAGTAKIDVSDVYDWYKLGQHISNLKGLGKHDFGKGPPSAIIAFGSEDEEHKYIKDLEKTGLTTTDIDPVDPKQPKGMKRQKVDPTYNVDESGVAEDEKINKLDLEFRVRRTGDIIEIYAELGGVMVGYAKFNVRGNNLVAGKVTVDPDYRRRGIATAMYDHAAELGYNIIPSESKTELGKLFWKDRKKDALLKVGKVVGQIENNDVMMGSGKEDAKQVKESSGYIPSESERNDPRFKTALTVDVHPDSIKRNASKLGLGKIKRTGVPSTARTDGKIR